jgi:hypothetical protein
MCGRQRVRSRFQGAHSRWRRRMIRGNRLWRGSQAALLRQITCRRALRAARSRLASDLRGDLPIRTCLCRLLLACISISVLPYPTHFGALDARAAVLLPPGSHLVSDRRGACGSDGRGAGWREGEIDVRLACLGRSPRRLGFVDSRTDILLLLGSIVTSDGSGAGGCDGRGTGRREG